MVVTNLYCECLNVCVTVNNDEKENSGLSKEKVQELEYKTGIFGLRESSASCQFRLPSLIGKRVLEGTEVYRCHLCNSDFFAVHNGHRMLTDLVHDQERHPNNYSCLFRVNIPPPLVNQENTSTNHVSFEYCDGKDRWFDIVDREKKRLYDELEKKIYDYFKKEEEIYNEKCTKIDQQCEQLKSVHADLIDSSEAIIAEDDILKLARPRGNVLSVMSRRSSAISDSNDDSYTGRRLSSTDSQYGVATQENNMFLLDEEEISALPNKDWADNRMSMSLLQNNESPSRLVEEEDIDQGAELEARKVKWRPSNMARSCAVTIARPELLSSPRSGYKGSSDEKTDEERISFEDGGHWIPPHTYAERLSRRIVPYSMPGRPASRD